MTMYVLRASGRTEESADHPAVCRAVREALVAAGREARHFVRVREDGSGEGWDAWPNGATMTYPAGTFPAELRPDGVHAFRRLCRDALYTPPGRRRDDHMADMLRGLALQMVEHPDERREDYARGGAGMVVRGERERRDAAWARLRELTLAQLLAAEARLALHGTQSADLAGTDPHGRPMTVREVLDLYTPFLRARLAA
jgi:hypothetical protein